MGPSGRGGVMQRPWWGCECMGILMKRLSAFMRLWVNDDLAPVVTERVTQRNRLAQCDHLPNSNYFKSNLRHVVSLPFISARIADFILVSVVLSIQ
ncbi:hypothetical protein M0802_013650 [Mischocyttarus mexicanus]|nr:hypothetical protein M0802_013650 [Mischocyttarus mexicanus]